MAKAKTLKKNNPFINGALILSASAIIVKIMSAVYRVPYQNLVGDIGFYIYQQVYPLYSIAILLSTLGFPVIFSKLYAERIRDGQDAEGKKILLSSFTVIGLFCFSIFLFLNIGSSFVAGKMGDENLRPLIKAVSYLYLLIPFLSVGRGYFQGCNTMVPTAISQIGEQTVRVLLILLFTFFMIGQGQSLYKIGEVAYFSSVLGSFIGSALLVGFFISRQGRFNFSLRDFLPSFSLARKILIQSIAVSISSLSIILFQLADSLQIYSSLLETGFSEESAKMLKGIFDRGQPILQFGLILSSSLALSIVPALVSEKIKGETFRFQARLGLKIGLVIGAAASVGLVLISDPLNIMLFETNDGTNALRILFFAVFLASVNATMIAVLQSLGLILLPAVIVLLGFAAKIVGNGFLLPLYGISGASFATNLGLLVITLLLRFVLRKALGDRLLPKGMLTNLFTALGFMAIAVFLSFIFMEPIQTLVGNHRIAATVQALLASILGAFTFLVASLRGGLFTDEELETIPKGERLKKWNKQSKVKGD